MNRPICGSHDLMLANPPEAASRGLCEQCGAELGERAFETARDIGPAYKVVCSECIRNYLIDRLNNVQPGEIITAIQEVDELSQCSTCDRFICLCGGD